MRKFILFALSLIYIAAGAAERKVTKLPLPNEIVTNKINAILRTTDGLMWIGTASGLSRFDGFGFINYQAVPGDSSTLQSNYVAALAEDPRGRLWVKTDVGFSVYDFATEQLSNNADALLRAMGIDGRVDHIIADPDQNLWLYVSGGDSALYVPRPDDDQAKRVAEGDMMTEGNVSGLAVCGKYLALANRLGRLILIDRQRGTIAGVIDDIMPDIDPNKEPEIQIYADRDDLLWVWTSQDLWIYDLRNRKLVDSQEVKKLAKGIMRVFLQDADGKMWIGRDHKGLVFLEKNASRGAITSADCTMPELDNHTVTCLYEDQNGTVWIGTYKHGLYCYSHAANKFDLSPMPDVNVIAPASNSEAWVGTDGDGLWLWDSDTKALRPISDPTESNDYSAITALAPDGRGGVYVGTYGRGLKHYANGRFSAVDAENLGESNIWSILPYTDGSLWIGTLGQGLMRYDPKTGNTLQYTAAHSGLPSNFIASLTTDQNGRIYLSTDNGVGILDPTTGRVTNIDRDRLSSPYVNQVLCDSRGYVWAATRNGLDLYLPEADSIKNINLYLASPQPHVLGLAEDKEGHIWVSVGSLLCCLTPIDADNLTYGIYVFNNSDGLTLSDFNQRSLAVLPNGVLAAGGLYGVSHCRPSELAFNTAAPHVNFTNLSINGQRVAPGEKVNGHVAIDKSILLSPTVNLYDTDNNFTVYFASDNYIVPEKTRFYYQLSGFTPDWTPCPAGSHYVTFANLASGKYKLRVKAINSDGVESETSAELEIVVHPPFWLSVWAYILYGILLGALLAGIYIYIRRREQQRFLAKKQEEELEKQEQLNQMKLRFFTNISHELRTPLTLIISPLEKLMKEIPDPEINKKLGVMHRNSTQLLYLVNQILDFRKSEMYGLQLETSMGDVVAFAAAALRNFESMAESRGITLGFDINVKELNMRFDKDKLGKILTNLLSNAMKFTPNGGKVKMTVNANGERVSIRVADTGIGISDADKPHVFERFYQAERSNTGSYAGTGIGLNMVWEYTKLHGGTVRVEDNPEGQGAVFMVDIPIQQGAAEIAESAAQSESTEGAPATDPTDKRPVALVVDDNPDIVDLLSDNLKEDFRVESATNGKEAWIKIVEQKPAVIISDVMMPIMDGIELCRKVKSDASTDQIPMILLTAKQDMQARIEGLTIGADDYLTKPFNNEELVLRTKRLVALTRGGARRQVLDPQPSNIKITSLDEKLVEKAVKYVEDNMERSELSVEELASHVGMSRVHLYKKLTQITGKSPVEFIRILRLKRAAQMLRESQLNISEIAFATGFGSPKYFSKYFKEEYGILPSAYQSTYGK
ncbi:MAG: response regulator [Bacteroidales bacterium]|nr:response regulator [Bacteroidales bacterium]